VVENSHHLFRYCRQALCHQMAQAMVDIATHAGVCARVVGLDGHVVVEAYYDDDWHGFDPHYGVVFRHGSRVLSVAELATLPRVAADVYSEHRLAYDSDEVLGILARQQITPMEPGCHLSPGTARLQRLAQGLKWWIPLLAMAIAAWRLVSVS
jgi:hypothetical protein